MLCLGTDPSQWVHNFSIKACDKLVASLTFVGTLLRISSVTKLFVVHLLFLYLWDQRQLTHLNKFSFLILLKHVSSFAAKWHIQKLIQDVLMVGFVHNMFDTFCGYGSWCQLGDRRDLVSSLIFCSSQVIEQLGLLGA